MKFVMNHNNINVRDLDKSLKFYQEAFGLTIAREQEAADGSFKLIRRAETVQDYFATFDCTEFTFSE